jgi:hypothetical protein
VNGDAGTEESTAGLAVAIVDDVRRLSESYLELTRLELATALRRAMQRAVATALAVLSLVWLSASAVLVLVDGTDLSRGGACALVGVALGVAGTSWWLTVSALARRVRQT